MVDISFATDDVLIYLAAAGSGKTTALTTEMTELLKVYRPDEIAFVTYTRKGVANGIDRALQANTQLSADDLVYYKTLHALCFRELGLKHASIIEHKDIDHFNRLLGFNVHLRTTFENQSDDDKLLSRYDALRSGSKKGIYVNGTYDEERYVRLTKAYESFKRINKLVDFHDCLLQFKERGKPVNCKVAFIDEAQDLTTLQWEVCELAFSTAEKIRISGDDYQCVFSHAGASPATLVNLANKYQTVKLEKSYRLSRSVYRFAKGITDIISDKIDKDFIPVKDVEGFVDDIADRNVLLHKIQLDITKYGLLPSRWYLLFRANCFIAEVADLLETSLIPYHTSKGFCLEERSLAKIKRYYNFRKKGFGTPDSFTKFCTENGIKDIQDNFTESRLIPGERRYMYNAYVDKYGIDALIEMANREPYILLSTTHKVKGGEADYVAVFLDGTKKVSENALFNIDEELRVLYVACTRAKTGLYLVSSRGRYGIDSIVDLVKEQMV